MPFLGIGVFLLSKYLTTKIGFDALTEELQPKSPRHCHMHNQHI
jgi:hypothetical protein